MLKFSKLFVCMALVAVAQPIGVASAAPDHAADIAKFKITCARSGGTFKQVKRNVYRCTAKNGFMQECNYTGKFAFCYGQEASIRLPTTVFAT